jgi:hypothetical protein
MIQCYRLQLLSLLTTNQYVGYQQPRRNHRQSITPRLLGLWPVVVLPLQMRFHVGNALGGVKRVGIYHALTVCAAYTTHGVLIVRAGVGTPPNAAVNCTV